MRALTVVALAAVLAVSGSAAGARSGGNGRIVFASNRDGDFEIYTMNARGGGLRKLTHNRVNDSCPAWSPNGRKIAFNSRRFGPDQILVMNADGSRVKRLTRNGFWDNCPAWSPPNRRPLRDEYRRERHTPAHP
jgi:Tol biopolymer transport system component